MLIWEEMAEHFRNTKRFVRSGDDGEVSAESLERTFKGDEEWARTFFDNVKGIISYRTIKDD